VNLTATESISVVIAEDREVLRLGQQQMVSAAGDFQVVGTAEDAETLLKVVGIERPRVVVLKDHLPGSLLVPLVKSMRELSPDTVVMIAMSCPDAFWTALDTHANGY
jgi:DNA-binding NarL/FixJ family response regulator